MIPSISTLSFQNLLTCDQPSVFCRKDLCELYQIEIQRSSQSLTVLKIRDLRRMGTLRNTFRTEVYFTSYQSLRDFRESAEISGKASPNNFDYPSNYFDRPVGIGLMKVLRQSFVLQNTVSSLVIYFASGQQIPIGSKSLLIYRCALKRKSPPFGLDCLSLITIRNNKT